MEIDKQALEHVFPKELLDHFEIEGVDLKLDKQTQEEYLEVVFAEKNVLPEGIGREDYESKGFFDKRVQDFPLRGRAVFLVVRRRRWRHKQTGEQVTRDFSFLAQGSKFTAELAAFFKRERLRTGLTPSVPWATITAWIRENSAGTIKGTAAGLTRGSRPAMPGNTCCTQPM